MDKPSFGEIGGVIFDLDGTLYDMPWFMKPLFYLALFPRSNRLPKFLRIRESFAGKAVGSRDTLIHAIADELSKQEKTSIKECADWITGPFYDAFISIMPFFKGNRPGLSEIMTGLRKKGIKLAVLSDYDKVPERLAKLKISTALFDTLASSESLGSLKPHKDPFVAIAQQWRILPQDVLVVGDRDDTDGIASKAASMRFQLINNKSKSSAGLSWKELAEKLHNTAVKKYENH